MTKLVDRRTVTIDDAARMLGIGRNLAYELALRGELPALRLGRRLVVPVEQLDALLAGSGQPEEARE